MLNMKISKQSTIFMVFFFFKGKKARFFSPPTADQLWLRSVLTKGQALHLIPPTVSGQANRQTWHWFADT